MAKKQQQEKWKKPKPGSLATMLLVGMGAAAVGSSLPYWRHLYGETFTLDIIRSGTRAGVVGGLADWFAVTALFRHPMGIPIPHTAILPKRKAQLGKALGRFVAEHFFTDHDMAVLLGRFNFTQVVVKTLREPAVTEAVLRHFRTIIPGLLKRLENGQGTVILEHMVPIFLRGEGAIPLVVRAMRAMVDEDVHQEVFSFFLVQFKEFVLAHEGELHRFVEERVREQGGRLVGWAIGGRVASQALGALKVELERVDPKNSELRHGFTRWVNTKLDELEENPEQLTRIMDRMADFLTHDTLKEWGGGLWRRLRKMAEDDSHRDDGWGAEASEALLQQGISVLETNTEFSNKINQLVSKGILYIVPGIRQEVAALIPRVMEKWDSTSLTERLENGVGQDLAFIRINGTVVGFLVGAFLEVFFGLLFG
ncbi:DUF445 family protein [Saccharibacter sp. 17.LH.SD]|uniref:DUF445 domain-containing protein n=1 Tax=Saccharibacter sp. 17.LH.SD TaxID=2689393 RepID=UPI0013687C21|nr:DUF445 domain-containing protein [Saccharibacter sp. 17.LH.SD]MXV44614.1 DUF445 family protein [Saccharibacter sp. 17.LH.SD]